jgi:hypothetical protein
MLSVRLDPDLERLLDYDVDDLAKYNILRYLNDHPDLQESVAFFAEELGLRSLDRTAEALEGLVCRGLLQKAASEGAGADLYGLSADQRNRELVQRLYRVSSTSEYGEIVERLAARSLHRARKALAAAARGVKSEPKP